MFIPPPRRLRLARASPLAEVLYALVLKWWNVDCGVHFVCGLFGQYLFGVLTMTFLKVCIIAILFAGASYSVALSDKTGFFQE